MTRDEALAKASKWLEGRWPGVVGSRGQGSLADLLQAVAAEEREAAAKECEAYIEEVKRFSEADTANNDARRIGVAGKIMHRIRARGTR